MIVVISFRLDYVTECVIFKTKCICSYEAIYNSIDVLQWSW